MSGASIRLVLWGLRRYVGGPGRSWLLTSLALAGFRLARRRVGRREVVEVIPLRPGDRFVISHLPDTHRDQLGAARRDRRLRR